MEIHHSSRSSLVSRSKNRSMSPGHNGSQRHVSTLKGSRNDNRRQSNGAKLLSPTRIKSRKHGQSTTHDLRMKTSEHSRVSLDKSTQSGLKFDRTALNGHHESGVATSHERRSREGRKTEVALKSRRDAALAHKHEEHYEKRSEHQSRLNSHSKHEPRSSVKLSSSNERMEPTDDSSHHGIKSKNVSDLRAKLERSRMKAQAHGHSRSRRHSSGDLSNRSTKHKPDIKLKSRNSKENIETLKTKPSAHSEKLSCRKISTVISKRDEASVESRHGQKRKASDEIFHQSSKRINVDVEIADADTSGARHTLDKPDQSKLMFAVDDVEVTSTAVVNTPDSTFFEDSMDSSTSGLDSLLAAKREILASLNTSFSPQLSDTSDRIMEANVSVNSRKPVISPGKSRKFVMASDNSISSSDVRTVVMESKEEHFVQKSVIADREESMDNIFECDVLCYTEEDMDGADRLCMSGTNYSDDRGLSNSPLKAPNHIDFEEGEISCDSWKNDDSTRRRIVQSNRDANIKENRRKSGNVKQPEERRHRISERRESARTPHDKRCEISRRPHRTERGHSGRH